MAIPLLALSDTHLGEDTSVLQFPEGRDRLAEALANEFGEGAEVDELILIGDIADRTLASTEQTREATRAFMKMMTSALRIKKIVYIPGNHDHSLWTEYVKAAHPVATQNAQITGPGGFQFLAPNDAPDESGPGMEELLYTFFDPDKPVPFEFVVANPVYVKRLPSRPRTYVFTHGTHLRGDVGAPPAVIKALHALHFDALADLCVMIPPKLTEQHTMADLEAAITPFVDTLWPSAGTNPVPKADRLWFLSCLLSGKFLKTRVIPESAPEELRCYLSQPDKAGGRIADLTPAHGTLASSLGRFKKYFHGVLVNYLTSYHLMDKPLTFIYGDTHEGGWGFLKEENICVYNTGAWVVTGFQHHPPCHIFCIPQAGEEFLLDVSFQYTEHQGASLLQQAAQDVENRKQKILTQDAKLRQQVSQLMTPPQSEG